MQGLAELRALSGVLAAAARPPRPQQGQEEKEAQGRRQSARPWHRGGSATHRCGRHGVRGSCGGVRRGGCRRGASISRRFSTAAEHFDCRGAHVLRVWHLLTGWSLLCVLDRAPAMVRGEHLAAARSLRRDRLPLAPGAARLLRRWRACPPTGLSYRVPLAARQEDRCVRRCAATRTEQQRDGPDAPQGQGQAQQPKEGQAEGVAPKLRSRIHSPLVDLCSPMIGPLSAIMDFPNVERANKAREGASHLTALALPY